MPNTRSVAIARLVVLSMALTWMGCCFAQASLEALRDKFEEHLQISAEKMEQLAQMQSIVNDLNRQNSRTSDRLTKMETEMDFIRTCVMGLLVPVFLLGIEAAVRIIPAAKRDGYTIKRD